MNMVLTADGRFAITSDMGLYESLWVIRTSDGKEGAFYLADIHWGDVGVDVVDWQTVSILGDEPIAEKRRLFHRRPKPKKNPVKNYQKAVRAYRQVAIVLRNQGLNEDAARFAYRAQLMQRATLREQMEASPLMDAARFARDVEAAYRTMWAAWCAERR